VALLRRDVGGVDHVARVSISTLIRRANSSGAAHRL
jgi:hypothetical protein